MAQMWVSVWPRSLMPFGFQILPDRMSVFHHVVGRGFDSLIPPKAELVQRLEQQLQMRRFESCLRVIGVAQMEEHWINNPGCDRLKIYLYEAFTSKNEPREARAELVGSNAACGKGTV